MIEEKDLVSLINKAKNGDELAFNKILKDKEKIINLIANKYFLPGGDHEDLVQHGRIGLYRGVKSFKAGKTDKADSFLNMCIKREIISSIIKYSRRKYETLNNSLSIKTPIKINNDGDTFTIENIIKHSDNIEKLILEKECTLKINSLLDMMDGIQKQTFLLYFEGYTQREICNFLNLNKKQVDNSLTRAKKRMREILSKRKIS